ncbi:HNH endonuclease, partial [Cronobacter malonaticus]
RVAANFGYRCAITGSGEALEAAHIEPVGTGNNNTSNGVLMLACLHRLFDAGMMAINPDTLTVHFRHDCTYFAKSMLEGTELN